MYIYNAKIIDIHDGDTVTALVDLGFKIQIEIKIRLYGINTPEITGATREEGLKSKQRVVDLIMGKEVTIKTYKDKQEKFGRWLADIYINAKLTKSVNQMLLEEGLAVSYMT